MGVKLKIEKILFKLHIFLNIGKNCHYSRLVLKPLGQAHRHRYQGRTGFKNTYVYRAGVITSSVVCMKPSKNETGF